jgi:hypothetical protein
MPRSSPQLICFSYHKSGTSLILHVMTKVSERLGLTLTNHYGLVRRLDPDPDVILLPHSLLRAPLDRPYRAIRLIRDPRDIWVSGYLYHLRCDEGWCRNADLRPTSPIAWPKVDYSVVHRPEQWKRRYLERLEGKSYQQNLLDRSLTDGLDFELEGYTGCTLTAMREWKLNAADALDVKLEDVMADFDEVMRRIFDHFGFTADQSRAALEVARSEDVRRMGGTAIAERPQIHSRTISKWREVLSPAQVARFEARNGDLIRALGYPLLAEDREIDAGRSGLNRRSPGRSHGPMVPTTTRDAAVVLSADGTCIRPATASQGSYTFIVPAHKEQIRLESRCGIPIDPGARSAGDIRRLGVRVSEVVIRSGERDFVIAPDDPRLVTGWHDAERAGGATWRWTDGSAELPWDGVRGPSVVIVRCMTLPEYAIHEDHEEPQPLESRAAA